MYKKFAKWVDEHVTWLHIVYLAACAIVVWINNIWG